MADTDPGLPPAAASVPSSGPAAAPPARTWGPLVTAIAWASLGAGVIALAVTIVYPKTQVAAIGCGLLFGGAVTTAAFVAWLVIALVGRMVRAARSAAAPRRSGPSASQALAMAGGGVLLLGSTCGMILNLGNGSMPGSWRWLDTAMPVALGAAWIVGLVAPLLLALAVLRNR